MGFSTLKGEIVQNRMLQEIVCFIVVALISIGIVLGLFVVILFLNFQLWLMVCGIVTLILLIIFIYRYIPVFK